MDGHWWGSRNGMACVRVVGRCVVDRRVYRRHFRSNVGVVLCVERVGGRWAVRHDRCVVGVVFVIGAISSAWAYRRGFVFARFIVAPSCYSGGGVGDVSKGKREDEW